MLVWSYLLVIWHEVIRFQSSTIIKLSREQHIKLTIPMQFTGLTWHIFWIFQDYANIWVTIHTLLKNRFQITLKNLRKLKDASNRLLSTLYSHKISAKETREIQIWSLSPFSCKHIPSQSFSNTSLSSSSLILSFSFRPKEWLLHPGTYFSLISFYLEGTGGRVQLYQLVCFQ